MQPHIYEHVVTLPPGASVWERVFTVAPLVLVGSLEADGRQNFAPKHMAFPLGWDNYFGFVCTPRHRTYHNIKREGAFTVSFPDASQVVLTSLAATPRDDDDIKPGLQAMPSFKATQVQGAFFVHSYLFLECLLDRVEDGFGHNSLIAGRIVAAHVHEVALRSVELDDHDLLDKSPLLAYLHPGRFASVRETYSFPFPSEYYD